MNGRNLPPQYRLTKAPKGFPKEGVVKLLPWHREEDRDQLRAAGIERAQPKSQLRNLFDFDAFVAPNRKPGPVEPKRPRQGRWHRDPARARKLPLEAIPTGEEILVLLDQTQFLTGRQVAHRFFTTPIQGERTVEMEKARALRAANRSLFRLKDRGWVRTGSRLHHDQGQALVGGGGQCLDGIMASRQCASCMRSILACGICGRRHVPIPSSFRKPLITRWRCGTCWSGFCGYRRPTTFR